MTQNEVPGPLAVNQDDLAVRDTRDASLEQKLVHMLSNLEYLRSCLEEFQAQGDPGQAVETATALVNQVVEFSQRHLDAEAQAPARAKLEDFLASAGRLREQVNGSLMKSVLGLFGRKTADSPQRRQSAREVSRRMADVLECYFALLTGCFQSPAPAGRWRETSGVFLGDLKRVLEKLEE
jgi:hypothetical protein